MSLVVVGLDRRSASAELLERVAVGSDLLDETLDILIKGDHVSEAVVLSTCMRTEIYCDAVRFHSTLDHLIDVLSQKADVSRASLVPQVFEFHDEEAYEHLFRVAAGLESAVIGESEVLGQVARAWEVARLHGACRSSLGALFRRAVEVGKRARSETTIARGVRSIGQAAVSMAEMHLGGLAGKSALVVGAGEMGRAMSITLSRVESVGEIRIANRTRARAEELAREVGATSIDLAEIETAISDADIVLACTASTEWLLDSQRIREVMELRPHRPLVVVDVAVPRDIDPAVSNVDGVTLLDMGDLQAFARRAQQAREDEVETVSRIVDEEVAKFCADANSRIVAPVVAALRDRVESIRLAELDRHASKLAGLDPHEQETVRALTKTMMSKLVHDPTVRLKNAAGTPEGDRMAEALRVLFGV